MICRDCGSEFVTFRGKPGFIDQCPACGAGDVELVGGNMIWSHKTAPEIEIKSMTQAKRFAKLQKRHGAGPLSAITQSKERAHQSLTGTGGDSSKQGTGAGDHDQYFSKLGEKRSVKL